MRVALLLLFPSLSLSFSLSLTRSAVKFTSRSARGRIAVQRVLQAGHRGRHATAFRQTSVTVDDEELPAQQDEREREGES